MVALKCFEVKTIEFYKDKPYHVKYFYGVRTIIIAQSGRPRMNGQEYKNIMEALDAASSIHCAIEYCGYIIRTDLSSIGKFILIEMNGAVFITEYDHFSAAFSLAAIYDNDNGDDPNDFIPTLMGEE